MRILMFLTVLVAGDLKSELDSLVQAERAFARLSTERGVRDAFLANLADDSIIFRPTAVPGRQWFETNSPSPGQLNWEPAFADIAAAGDLGYTTGPWERSRTAQEAPMSFGHYVTLWRKQADGKWKVALDAGISHAAAPRPRSVQSPPVRGSVQKQRPQKEIEAAKTALLDLELRFPPTPQAALSGFDPAARLYRNGSFPFVGQTAVRKALSDVKGAFAWKVARLEVSGSADLAYAYGTADFKPAAASQPIEQSNFVRIWKKQNGVWKVVLDLAD